MSMGQGTSLQAIEGLYRSHYRIFLRTAIALADGREAGRDAVHDAFVDAVQKRHAYREDGTLEAWVWPIVIRAALKHKRKENQSVPGHATNDAVWADTRPQDQYCEVRNAVAALPSRQRVMLFLRYYGDLDYEAIAAATGVRIGTVGAELNAARTHLRRYLEEAVV